MNRFWVFSLFLILFFLSCSPKRMVVDRTVRSADSLSLATLHREIDSKTNTIVRLQSELKRLREINTQLQSETVTHEIVYDTTGVVNEQNEYPKARETMTMHNRHIATMVSEYEESKHAYEHTIAEQIRMIEQLQREIGVHVDENRLLKAKQTPQTGFGLRLIFWSFLIGVLVAVLGCVYWKFRIKI